MTHLKNAQEWLSKTDHEFGECTEAYWGPSEESCRRMVKGKKFVFTQKLDFVLLFAEDLPRTEPTGRVLVICTRAREREDYQRFLREKYPHVDWVFSGVATETWWRHPDVRQTLKDLMAKNIVELVPDDRHDQL